MVPPDPISNSEVKRNRADGSVGSPHVRVGHFQAPNLLVKSSREATLLRWLFCFWGFVKLLTLRLEFTSADIRWLIHLSTYVQCLLPMSVDNCILHNRHFRHPWRSPAAKQALPLRIIDSPRSSKPEYFVFKTAYFHPHVRVGHFQAPL